MYYYFFTSKSDFHLLGEYQGGRIARETIIALEITLAHYSGKYSFAHISLLSFEVC
jgi:hypothetical protein